MLVYTYILKPLAWTNYTILLFCITILFFLPLLNDYSNQQTSRLVLKCAADSV